MLERSLYRSIIAGALRESWALYRIGDGAAGMKPFDIGGVSPTGKAVGLEVKIDETLEKAMKRVSRHQEAWMTRLNEVGAIGLSLVKIEGNVQIIVVRRDVAIGKLSLVDSCYVGWSKLGVE